jgi:hypothetical protein
MMSLSMVDWGWMMLRSVLIHGLGGAFVLCLLLVAGAVMRLASWLVLLAALFIPFVVAYSTAENSLHRGRLALKGQAAIEGAVASLIAGANGSAAALLILNMLYLYTPFELSYIPPEFFGIAYLLLGLVGGALAVERFRGQRQNAVG